MKLKKIQKEQANKVISLFHKMIKSFMDDNREDYEKVIEELKGVING